MKRNLINGLKAFWNKEDGVGTLELLLIVAVLVVIALAFRRWIVKWVTNLFTKADANMNEIKDINVDQIQPQNT